MQLAKSAEKNMNDCSVKKFVLVELPEMLVGTLMV